MIRKLSVPSRQKNTLIESSMPKWNVKYEIPIQKMGIATLFQISIRTFFMSISREIDDIVPFLPQNTWQTKSSHKSFKCSKTCSKCVEKRGNT